jgi:hypothetical protein
MDEEEYSPPRRRVRRGKRGFVKAFSLRALRGGIPSFSSSKICPHSENFF